MWEKIEKYSKLTWLDILILKVLLSDDRKFSYREISKKLQEMQPYYGFKVPARQHFYRRMSELSKIGLIEQLKDAVIFVGITKSERTSVASHVGKIFDWSERLQVGLVKKEELDG